MKRYVCMYVCIFLLDTLVPTIAEDNFPEYFMAFWLDAELLT